VSPVALAEVVLVCPVIGITDGNSLTARCKLPTGAENIKVRLAEIDAPEKAQPFGNRSNQHLADLCFKKPATLSVQTKNRWTSGISGFSSHLLGIAHPLPWRCNEPLPRSQRGRARSVYGARVRHHLPRRRRARSDHA
jgi:hypothetical protein